jgi:hypothetical protein
MTVYVDNSRIPAKVGRYQSRWSHLFADTQQELHAFADRIGLHRAWFQDAPRTWHYDVTEGMRAKAIHAGAVPVTWRDSVRIIRERDGLPPIGPTDPPDKLPIDTQGAAPSAKTTAAPCHPATSNQHEVHPS